MSNERRGRSALGGAGRSAQLRPVARMESSILATSGMLVTPRRCFIIGQLDCDLAA